MVGLNWTPLLKFTTCVSVATVATLISPYIGCIVFCIHNSRGAICLKCNTSIKGISELLLTREREGRERAVIFLVHDNSCQIMHGFHQQWRVHQLSLSFFLFSFFIYISYPFHFLNPTNSSEQQPKETKDPMWQCFQKIMIYLHCSLHHLVYN